MARRVSLEATEFDREFIALSQITNAETNSARIQLMKRALSKVIQQDLTPRQRQVILLYYYEGLTMTEIARQLGIDPSTVSRTVSRGRRNILNYLKYFLD